MANSQQLYDSLLNQYEMATSSSSEKDIIIKMSNQIEEKYGEPKAKLLNDCMLKKQSLKESVSMDDFSDFCHEYKKLSIPYHELSIVKEKLKSKLGLS